MTRPCEKELGPCRAVLDSPASPLYLLFMMNTPLTAAIARSIVVELAVDATSADAAIATARKAGGRLSAAVDMIGADESLALLRSEITAWSKRRARWAKAAR